MHFCQLLNKIEYDIKSTVFKSLQLIFFNFGKN